VIEKYDFSPSDLAGVLEQILGEPAPLYQPPPHRSIHSDDDQDSANEDDAIGCDLAYAELMAGLKLNPYHLVVVRGAPGCIGPSAERLGGLCSEQDLYLSYGKIDGRSVWGSMRKKHHPTQVSEESDSQDEQKNSPPDTPRVPYHLPDFNWEYWTFNRGAKHAIGHRRDVTAAHAIYDSLEAQYPDSEYVSNHRASDVLAHLDRATGPSRNSHHSAEEGAAALKTYTNDEYKLIVVEAEGNPSNPVYNATRWSLGDGHEVFVNYRETLSRQRGMEVRWQQLFRKPKTDAKSPSGSSQSKKSEDGKGTTPKEGETDSTDRSSSSKRKNPDSEKEPDPKRRKTVQKLDHQVLRGTVVTRYPSH
jgi:hypothetical protein